MDLQIKIEINLSESTMKYLDGFIGAIAGKQVASVQTATEQPAKQVAPATTTGKQVAPATPAQTAKPVAPTQTAKPVAPTTPTQTAKPVAPTTPTQTATHEGACTIAELRSLLGTKVEVHREAIREKLKQLSASSITTLDVAHYGDMMDFLKSL